MFICIVWLGDKYSAFQFFVKIFFFFLWEDLFVTYKDI